MSLFQHNCHHFLQSNQIYQRENDHVLLSGCIHKRYTEKNTWTSNWLKVVGVDAEKIKKKIKNGFSLKISKKSSTIFNKHLLMREE